MMASEIKNKLLRLFDTVELNKLKNDVKIHIITGPILGKITHDSVNILLEINQDIADLECTLINISDLSHPSSRVILEFVKCRPGVYTFTGLKPNTSYRFVVTDKRITDEERIKNEARITTFSEKPNKFDVIVVSGNELKNIKDWLNSEENMWKHLYERFAIERQYHCIVHLGNQVNLRNCVEYLLKNQKLLMNIKKEEVHDYIKEIFRVTYRTNWSKKYVKQVMGMTQNLMIWGSGDSLLYCHQKDNTLSIVDYCTNEIKKNVGVEVNMYKIAHEVYCEYQRQLWDNSNVIHPREFHYHQWGKYGLFFFDMKGNRLKNYGGSSSVSLLGNTQVKALKEFLNCPDLEIPIICSDHPFVEILDDFDDDGSGTTAWPSHEKDIYNIYRFLERWQITNKVGKKIILLSGSMENGGAKIIINNQKDMSKQIVQMSCGPIADKVSQLSAKTTDIVYRKWNIKHIGIAKSNYGKINMSIHDGRNVIVAEIVTSKTKIAPDDDDTATPLPPIGTDNKLSEVVTIELKKDSICDDQLAFETTENYLEPGDESTCASPEELKPDKVNIDKLKSIVFNNGNNNNINNINNKTNLSNECEEPVLKPPILISTSTPIIHTEEKVVINNETERLKEKSKGKPKEKRGPGRSQVLIDTYDKEYQEILNLLSDEMTTANKKRKSKDEHDQESENESSRSHSDRHSSNESDDDNDSNDNDKNSDNNNNDKYNDKNNKNNDKNHDNDVVNEEDLNKAIEEAIQKIGTAGLTATTSKTENIDDDFVSSRIKNVKYK